MNIKSFLFITSLFISPVTWGDTCSPGDKHQSKFEKFAMDELPSLLDSCGLGGLIDVDISLPGFDLDDPELFCGYKASDISKWYSGENSTNNLGASPFRGSSQTRKLSPQKIVPTDGAKWNPSKIFN